MKYAGTAPGLSQVQGVLACGRALQATKGIDGLGKTFLLSLFAFPPSGSILLFLSS